REPMRYTPSAVRPAPRIATWMNAVAVVSVNQAMPITTAREAPVVTPRMPGSAIGLRVTPCITAPETASPAPASRASRVRGMRRATAAWSKPSADPDRAARMSFSSTSREPNATETATSTTSRATSPAAAAARTSRGRRRALVPGVAASTVAIAGSLPGAGGIDGVGQQRHVVLDQGGNLQRGGVGSGAQWFVPGQVHDGVIGHGGQLGQQRVGLEGIGEFLAAVGDEHVHIGEDIGALGREAAAEGVGVGGELLQALRDLHAQVLEVLG